MYTAQRRHYDAIQQLARDEWPCDGARQNHMPGMAGDNRTLTRIREEKPDTFAALKNILDNFTPPRDGDAFFPYEADEELADALVGVGWEVRFFSSSSVYSARHPVTRAKFHHLHGDLYDRTRIRPEARRCADPVADITVGGPGLPDIEEANL